jgi:hypothetical protein
MLFVFTVCNNSIKILRITDNFITYSRCTRTEEEIFILHQNIPQNTLKKNGGDKEDRTPDLLNANQALSQLSYVPVEEKWWAWADLNCRPHAYQACALTN